MISVIPGAWATEGRAPILDLVVPAVEALDVAEKMLIWVAGEDADALTDRLRNVKDTAVVVQCSPIEKLIVASDLVITKANRGSTLEVAQVGIPSISLSHGSNAVDDVVVARIPTNTALDARGVDDAFLAEVMRDALRGRAVRTASSQRSDGAAAAAAELLAFISAHASNSWSRPVVV